MEYDQDTCVTALELRDMSVAIPDRVPDCAWVPKYALSFDMIAIEHGLTDGEVNCTFGIDVTEPFRWVTATFKKKEGSNK